MPRPSIFLYDIDGTILNGGGVGRRAMEAAFAEVVGNVEALRQVRFSGMTDRGIVRAGLHHAKLASSASVEDVIDAVLEAYIERLPVEIEAGPTYRILEGLEAALELTESLADAAVGLGTGNIEPGARAKLEPLGINPRFSFGGFGSDAEDRAELLGVGAERGADRLGVPRGVVVIGDTPRDVDAAARIGAGCLAVATGTYRLDELQAAQPTLAVGRLDVPEALAFLRG